MSICRFYKEREKVRNWVGVEVRVWEELGEGKHDWNVFFEKITFN